MTPNELTNEVPVTLKEDDYSWKAYSSKLSFSTEFLHYPPLFSKTVHQSGIVVFPSINKNVYIKINASKQRNKPLPKQNKTTPNCPSPRNEYEEPEWKKIWSRGIVLKNNLF